MVTNSTLTNLVHVGQVAEQILSHSLGERMQLRLTRVHAGEKSVVLRGHLLHPSPGLPQTVIVKQVRHSNLLEDWAASLFLEHVPSSPPFAPRCYVANLDEQLLILEDLGEGDGRTPYTALLDSRPEEAAASLVELSHLMGRLHAATLGRGDAYRSIRHALGPLAPPQPLYHAPWVPARDSSLSPGELTRVVEEYHASFRTVGLVPCPGVEEAIALVSARVEEAPGAFLAFCQGDVNTPGNCIRCDTQLRLLDFDSSGLRHALLEGVAGRLMWGCEAQLPAWVISTMEGAYRAALAAGCCAARDEVVYTRAIAEAAAWWHIFHVIWRLPTALAHDYQRGLTSLRQQMLAWLEAFAALTEESNHMCALGHSARALRRCLRTLWPREVAERPYWPAFRV